MALQQLDNLVSIGKLKTEAPAPEELDGLLRSGRARIRDAENATLSIESRFDPAHAFALAALRCHGYRSENRYIVFQTLQETVNLPPLQWRILDTAHQKRNRSEYEGDIDVDAALVDSLVRIAREVEKRVSALIANAKRS